MFAVIDDMGEEFVNIRAHEGRVNRRVLTEIVDGADAEYFVCGPPSFLGAMREVLWFMGVLNKHIHYEYFGPTQKAKE